MKIDYRRLNILNYLFDYRGMNAKQMAAFIYRTPYFTVSNLKQVQRDLKNLTDNNYVTKFLYDEPIVDEEGIIKMQKVSMYYLTQSGYTYMLEHYNVLQGQLGSGFLIDLNNEFVYGDIPYTTHTPPQKYFDHHLMAIDAFIQMCFGWRLIPHRNNLYAAKKFGENRLRPDAEALINGQTYFLEFDRYTENHEKLMEKFKTYTLYFDTLEEEELQQLGKIVFVVDDNGKDRRWNNILSAYIKAIGRYLSYVPLVMCEISELNYVLKYEMDQEMINTDVLEEWNEENEKLFFTQDKTLICRVIDNYIIEFFSFQHQYDSTLFTRLKIISDEAHKKNWKVNNVITFITPYFLKELKLNLAHYDVPVEFVKFYDFYKSAHKQYLSYPDMYLNELDDGYL